MNINEALLQVKLKLTKERYDHTLRVVKQAVQLAKSYGVEIEKAELAAAFHDYAKCQPLEELKRLIVASTLPKDLLHYHHELWHGPVGALQVETEFGITDIDILSAIKHHTTGKAHMSQLEMITYLADYIEPGRSFPGLEEVRKMAEKDLVHATWMVSRNSIQFLVGREMRVYPDTIHAYNDLTKRLIDDR